MCPTVLQVSLGVLRFSKATELFSGWVMLRFLKKPLVHPCTNHPISNKCKLLATPLSKPQSLLAAKNTQTQGILINILIQEVGFFNTGLFYSQFLLMRMTRMIPCGSWTMTIWRTCMECLRRSMVS